MAYKKLTAQLTFLFLFVGTRRGEEGYRNMYTKINTHTQIRHTYRVCL